MRVFLDTETTGLHPGQIAQLSYIITDDQLQPIVAKNYYFQVDSMDPRASAVNGLTLQSLQQLSHGRRFADCGLEISAELAEHPVICHNVTFDRKFMDAEYRRVGQRYQPRADFCTMINLAPTFGKRPKLSEAIQHFAISSLEIAREAQRLFQCGAADAHDARYDVTATLLVSRRAHTLITPWIRATSDGPEPQPAAAEAAATAEQDLTPRGVPGRRPRR